MTQVLNQRERAHFNSRSEPSLGTDHRPHVYIPFTARTQAGLSEEVHPTPGRSDEPRSRGGDERDCGGGLGGDPGEEFLPQPVADKLHRMSVPIAVPGVRRHMTEGTTTRVRRSFRRGYARVVQASAPSTRILSPRSCNGVLPPRDRRSHGLVAAQGGIRPLPSTETAVSSRSAGRPWNGCSRQDRRPESGCRHPRVAGRVPPEGVGPPAIGVQRNESDLRDRVR